MCSDCPTIPAADAAAETKRCVESIQLISKTIDGHISTCMLVEEQYCEAGISYHTSQLSARQPHVFPQSQLSDLAQMFETSSVTEHKALFAGLHASVAQLTDICSRYARIHGTVDQLYHRLFKELEPRWQEAYEAFQAHVDKFQECFGAAERLREVSRAIYETDDNGFRCAWHDASGPDPLNHPIPTRLGEEWVKYRAWM